MPVSPIGAAPAGPCGWFGAVITFLYLPIAFIVVFSFGEGDAGLPITGLTLHWYEEMLRQFDPQRAVFNSVIVASWWRS